ncbi:MAG: hypothetical protein CMH41_00760, partial [Micrococcales bacterium]|nr:hypothetical protein [Micrococcales bacterium]
QGTVAGGKAPWGGGIYNNEFKDPDSGEYVKATVNLNGASIETNHANIGGGIYNNRGTVELQGDGYLVGGGEPGDANTADSFGGGIYNDNGRVTLNSGEITYNTTKGDGGGIVNTGHSAMLTLNGGSIDHNKAKYDGGGIYTTIKANVDMRGGSISNNTAEDGGGIGGYIAMDITGGEITNNKATGGGGGIYMHKGELNVNGQEINKEDAARNFVHDNTANDPNTQNIRFP